MTAPQLASWASVVTGFLGTVPLFKGSFAYESLPQYTSTEGVKALARKNKRRRLFQRLGLALLSASFAAQGVALVLG